MAFKHVGLPLPQPTLSLDPFSMTNDQIIKKVYKTHITEDENYDVKALLDIVVNIIKHSAQFVGTDLPKAAVLIELAKDQPLPDHLDLPFSKIKQIIYQLTSDAACDVDHAHQTTMKILHELETSNWGTKAAVVLGAFAVEYGNLLHLVEIQEKPAPLEKSLALLSGFVINRSKGKEIMRQAFAELNNLVNKVLQVTEQIIALENFSTVDYDQGDESKVSEATGEILVDVYWTIISIAACFTHIGYLKGDSENKMELLQFDQKLNTILTNLTVHVTKMRKETAALQKTHLSLTKTKEAPQCLTLGKKWKNTFPYGVRGIDGTHLADIFATPSTRVILPLTRKSFPDGFIFGTATSAYQIEGGAKERGRSAWDHFTHKYPKRIKDQSNGDVACNSYKLYEEDIRILKDMNGDAYRFSISWSRIIPNGKRSEGIRKEGIDYYNNLINLVLDEGLTPFVTLYHVNRPQALEDKYGGFLSDDIVDDFRDFADLCFERFGDRVKYWITLNEPYTYCYCGYVDGSMAPARCSCWQHLDCLGGDSGTEPYKVGHNLLLAHAAAFQLYKNKYQDSQNGVIGITLNSLWAVPYSSKSEDHHAASRAMDFVLGWFMEPITVGDYPLTMRLWVKERLPKFSPEQSQQLQGSFDFIGLNYYTSMYAKNKPDSITPPCYITDTHVTLSYFRNGKPIGEPTGSGMYSYPEGLLMLLCYIKDMYKNPLIYITENGMAQFNFPHLPIGVSLLDVQRVRYHSDHIYYVHSAIKDCGVNAKGYFVWSLLDNFEWSLGYTARFGMHFVNFGDNEKVRYPKLSADWFKLFLNN